MVEIRQFHRKVNTLLYLRKLGSDSRVPIGLNHLLILLLIEHYGKATIDEVAAQLELERGTAEGMVARLTEGTPRRKGMGLLHRYRCPDSSSARGLPPYCYELTDLGRSMMSGLLSD